MDEHLELELDATAISWIFTSNRLEKIRPELLSRLEIVEIHAPTRAQMPAMIRSIDLALRSELPGLNRAFHTLDENLIAHLGTLPPRDLKQLLRRMYSLAAANARRSTGRLRLTVELYATLAASAPAVAVAAKQEGDADPQDPPIAISRLH